MVRGMSAANEPEPRPEQIGPYRILELLGEGGMGTVWLAERREPVRARVALKVVKAGMDTRTVLARFEAERQALAMMEHSCIAKVFDAGTTAEGRPYFVMEYVKGVPITRYCDEYLVPLEERLRLFRQVCAGVQHAHMKGVMHRDLKPGNVLVTVQDGKPQPKIIDFGLAKAVDHRLVAATVFTQHGQVLGTPEYMSPEQAGLGGLDVDTRTDVYSLGVLLYELLTGALPFPRTTLLHAGWLEMQRILRESEPTKPSTRITTIGAAAADAAQRRGVDVATLRRRLQGDLDWIVLRAIEKDRTRRYETPLELAADLERHLRCEPVLASPPSLGYRASKFVARFRLQCAAAAVIGLAVVGAAVVSFGYYRMAMAANAGLQDQRDRALRYLGMLRTMAMLPEQERWLLATNPQEAASLRAEITTALASLDAGVASLAAELVRVEARGVAPAVAGGAWSFADPVDAEHHRMLAETAKALQWVVDHSGGLLLKGRKQEWAMHFKSSGAAWGD